MNTVNCIIKNKSILFGACFLVALLCALLVQGAIPFLAAPTLGQAVWTTGFSQSFANDSVFSIYARNFGAPEPAAIAFGLSGAWPTSIFMRLGMSAIDAYTTMAALWLTIAFFSAYKIGRHFNVSPFLAILGGLTWMTMPIIWAHAGYSMLSLGISLLPFYFLSPLRLFSVKNNALKKSNVATMAGRYLFVCLVSVFMDGYSFMMFATGSTILLIAALYRASRVERISLFKFSLPVHFFCFFLAYLLFSVFIGKSEFDSEPIDFFRGWGVDVIFMLIPTKGTHWIMDIIGINASRSEKYFWGDASTWLTSFCAPVVMVGILSAWKTRHEKKRFIGFVLITVFGIYMALGSSLKFNSQKPAEYEAKRMMPVEHGVALTGTGILSANVPGFTVMRASYRWLALGIFGAWMLTLLLFSAKKRKYKVYGCVVLSVIILLNLPDPIQKLNEYVSNRNSFFSLERDVVADMEDFVSPGDKLAFLPWRNDFLANYMASRLDVVSYNIGGDKNLNEARKHWPEIMRQFPMASVDKDFSDRVLLLLSEKEADVVIFPYIDMLWAAHKWPYPASFKEDMAPTIRKLNESGIVEIVEREYFSVVKLLPRWHNKPTSDVLASAGLCIVPFCLERDGFSLPFHSRIGMLKDQYIESTKRKGMLHFGPYVPMKKGRYRLVVYGAAKTTGAAWADVASDQGKITHGRFNLFEKDKLSDQILVDTVIAFDHDVRAVEIRVHVESEDEVSLRGYSMKMVENP